MCMHCTSCTYILCTLQVMSLVECICCSRHGEYVAVCWDPYLQDKCNSISFWTYSELVNTSFIISDYLRKTCSSNRVVGLFGQSCPDVLMGLIAVLSIPTAYLPLNTLRPHKHWVGVLQRNGVEVIVVKDTQLEAMLNECSTLLPYCSITLDCGLLLYGLVVAVLNWHTDELRSDSDTTFSGIYEQLSMSTYGEQVDLVCSVCKQQGFPPSPWVFLQVCPTSLAYVLSTSGTTGQPASVRVPHCCIVPNIIDLRSKFSCNHNDVVFNAAPLTFDPSVIEIFVCLSAGATLLIVPDAVKQSPHHLATVLFRRHSVSVLQATPSLVCRFAIDDLKGGLLGPDSRIKTMAFGGEKCPDYNRLAGWKAPSNTTSVFNLYGLTEVSSWASCHHLNEPVPGSMSDCPSGQVPLGEPLLGTRLELRDECGTPVQCGEGVIWAGGDYRCCLLEGEQTLQAGCMRCTGDLGVIDESGQLLFSGRCDSQVKRLGHRVNLDFIQQSLESIEDVTSCVVTKKKQRDSIEDHDIPSESLQIISFVVPKDERLLSDNPTHLSQFKDLRHALFSEMRSRVPQSCIPDDIVFVRHLPVTKHGKVDVASLLNNSDPDIVLKDYELETILRPCESVDVIAGLLQEAAYSTIDLKAWDKDVKLRDVGVTSFDIVRIATHFETILMKYLQSRSLVAEIIDELIENFLLMTLCEVSLSIFSRIEKEVPETVEACVDEELSFIGEKSMKRVHVDGHPVMHKVPKLAKPDTQKTVKLSPDVCEFCDTQSWRSGKIYQNGELLPNVMDSASIPHSFTKGDVVCNMSTRWKVSTGKCVDASPLVAQCTSKHDVTVFIGSHSGLFFAIDYHSGVVNWKVQLPDRIESSACLSKCGLLVCVGCYDGRFYIMNTDDGSLHWTFTLPSAISDIVLEDGYFPVKSSPCVDPQTGFVWFGAHDNHIYAVDIQTKSLVHRVYPGGGSCFSSPCIDSGVLYSATLQGRIVAINTDTGLIEWSFLCPKPIFSSPTHFAPNGSSLVSVGCVDGKLYVLGDNGTSITKMCTGNAIFSTCSIVHDRGSSKMKLLSGSHDKHIYCWNENYELEWKLQLDSEVYSTPCFGILSIFSNKQSLLDNTADTVDPMPSTQSKGPLTSVPSICVCSSAGYVYIVNVTNGCLIGSFVLPGDIFSSPVMFYDSVIVGCRDDYVYCLDVNLS